MSELIPIALKRAAVALAEQLNYLQAAVQLNISPSELRDQIVALETQLYVHIFKPGQEQVELTREGQFLVSAFRESLTLHERRNPHRTSDTAE